MQIRWLRRALFDLDEIASFISEDSRPAAMQVVAEIVRQTGLLGEQPSLGRPGRVAGTRELVLSGLPFIVPYRVRGDMVELLRVMHTAKQWPTRFKSSEPRTAYVARPQADAAARGRPRRPSLAVRSRRA